MSWRTVQIKQGRAGHRRLCRHLHTHAQKAADRKQSVWCGMESMTASEQGSNNIIAEAKEYAFGNSTQCAQTGL